MKATPEEIAAYLDKEIESLKRDAQRIQDRIAFICQHHWRCCKVGVMPNVIYSGLEFQNCERTEAFAVMKAFGGKWDKSPNYTGQGIDYDQWFPNGDNPYGARITVSNAKPPPSCQVVEEIVGVPAQPARFEKKYKLQCAKPLEGTDTTLPVPTDPSQVQSVEQINAQESDEIPF
jgi:hypothetical protein